MVATEEIIFPSQSNWTYDIFSQIVIPKQASVLQACHHVVPSGIGICDSLSGQRVGAVLDTFRFHPHFHSFHYGFGQFQAFRLSLFIREACFIAAVINLVYILYLSQCVLGHLPVFIQSLLKMTAYMHQAVE